MRDWEDKVEGIMYQIVPHDIVIEIHSTVAVCPYCGGKLTVQLDTWTQLDDGQWGVMEGETPHVACETEPDMGDTEAWCEWCDSHSYMPYVHVLPVEVKVTKWLNANYRFDMKASARQEEIC